MESFVVILLLILAVLIVIVPIAIIVKLCNSVIRTADATEETNKLLRVLIKDLREKNASSENTPTESNS